jgi:hypothetical protein
MNEFLKLIPKRFRDALYAAMILAGVIITGLLAGFASGGSTVPGWLVFTSAFYGAVAGPSFAVAKANIQ